MHARQRLSMIIRHSWRPAGLLACAMFVLCAAAHAAEVPIVTGEHWTRSSEEVQKAYLVGIANIVQIETAYYGSNPAPDNQSFVPRLSKGLRGETLDSVRTRLNRWYSDHPDQLKRPVMETVWFELAVPGLAKSN